jgi:hypothetical protein
MSRGRLTKRPGEPREEKSGSTRAPSSGAVTTDSRTAMWGVCWRLTEIRTEESMDARFCEERSGLQQGSVFFGMLQW